MLDGYSAGRGTGQITHVLDGVVVELQRPGKALEDLIRGLAFAALFKSQVILGADAGQHGDFFATQTHDPPAVPLGQTHIGGFKRSRRVRRKVANPLDSAMSDDNAVASNEGSPPLPGITRADNHARHQQPASNRPQDHHCW